MENYFCKSDAFANAVVLGGRATGSAVQWGAQLGLGSLVCYPRSSSVAVRASPPPVPWGGRTFSSEHISGPQYLSSPVCQELLASKQ